LIDSAKKTDDIATSTAPGMTKRVLDEDCIDKQQEEGEKLVVFSY